MSASLKAGVVLCALAAAAAVYAADLTVDEIVARANRVAYYQGHDGRALVRMEIKDNQGRTDQREFLILRRDDPRPSAAEPDDSYTGNQKFYVFFRLPADLNRMVFMVWKHVDKEDDRWLYTPALDNVKRIAASDKRTSFVGSHFYYEDVSGRNLRDDTHELTRTTDLYYVLRNTPRDPASVEFAHYEMYVHKETFVTVQVKYFDARGENYRTYTALNVETIQGFPTVTKSVMEDKRLNGSTTVTYDKVAYNIGLPEDVFTERYLRRPPREYLR